MGILEGLKRTLNIAGSKIDVVLEDEIYSQFDLIRGDPMIRRVSLAFLLCSLVACGDGIVTAEDIAGIYRVETINGEEFRGYAFRSVNPDGSQLITEVDGAQVDLDPDSSCDVGVTSTISVFDTFGFFVGETTTISTDPCTFEFSDPAITLNYTDGRVETGSVAGSTLTLTRGDDVWVYRQ